MAMNNHIWPFPLQLGEWSASDTALPTCTNSFCPNWSRL